MLSLICVLFHRKSTRRIDFIGNGASDDERRCGMCSFSTMAHPPCSSILFSHNGFRLLFPFVLRLLLAQNSRKSNAFEGNLRLTSLAPSDTRKAEIMMICSPELSLKKIVILFFFNVTIITWLNCSFLAALGADPTNMTKIQFRWHTLASKWMAEDLIDWI